MLKSKYEPETEEEASLNGVRTQMLVDPVN